jgi:uncharacterized protein (DUF2062 family)
MGQRMRRWRVAARRALRRIVYSESSASSIAGGMALGIFIGLTPTFGFQMIPAAFFAALFRVNILAAVVAVWITNPFTAAFIYYTEYMLGTVILPFGPGSDTASGIARLAEKVSAISMVDMWNTVGAAIGAFLSLGSDVITRLIIGSLVAATAGAGITYPVTFWAVRYVRGRRKVDALRRADDRLARLSAAGLVHVEPAEKSPASADEDDRPDAERPPQIVSLPISKPAAPDDPEGRPPSDRHNGTG